jgi:hypothetical protein
MRKLTLDVNLLAVESFEVAGRTGTGTVAGHEAAVDGGTGAVVVGPDTGTIEVYSDRCWTIQEECFITKDPRYYPCVCTYPIRDTYDGSQCVAVADPSDVKAAY